jgi:hypothetical protein
LAHRIELIDMSLAISFSSKARITRIFINIASIKKCEPRFDVPCWNKNSHTISLLACTLSISPNHSFQLPNSFCPTPSICIYHSNQRLATDAGSSLLIVIELLYELLTNELLSSTSSTGANHAS